jgi:hypothetical protein
MTWTAPNAWKLTHQVSSNSGCWPSKKRTKRQLLSGTCTKTFTTPCSSRRAMAWHLNDKGSHKAKIAKHFTLEDNWDRNSGRLSSPFFAFLHLGHRGGLLFDFGTELISDNTTFGRLRCIGFQHEQMDFNTHFSKSRQHLIVLPTAQRRAQRRFFRWHLSGSCHWVLRRFILLALHRLGRALICSLIVRGIIASLRKYNTYLWNQFKFIESNDIIALESIPRCPLLKTGILCKLETEK